MEKQVKQTILAMKSNEPPILPIKTNKPPIIAIKSNTSLILAIKVIKPPFSRFVAQLSPPATILTLKSYTQIVYWGIQEKQFSRQVAAMRFIDPE